MLQGTAFCPALHFDPARHVMNRNLSCLGMVNAIIILRACKLLIDHEYAFYDFANGSITRVIETEVVPCPNFLPVSYFVCYISGVFHCAHHKTIFLEIPKIIGVEGLSPLRLWRVKLFCACALLVFCFILLQVMIDLSWSCNDQGLSRYVVRRLRSTLGLNSYFWSLLNLQLIISP